MAERLEWKAVGDDGTCADCEERNGTTATMEQWVQWGLPGSGVTVCLSNCRCELTSEGEVVEAPRLAEQVRVVEDSPEFQEQVARIEQRAATALRNAGASQERIDEVLGRWRHADGTVNLRRIPPASRAVLWRTAASLLRRGD